MTVAPEVSQFKLATLYVGDLHPNVSDGLLHQKFSELGLVINARVCRDFVSRLSLGYGYVNFRDPKDAQHAMDVMNYSMLSGRPLRLMWSQKDPTLRKSGKGNIFIKNLEKSITPLELYDTFEQFGDILSCKLVTDENGNSKGFGFVHYESEESAEKAITYVNGKKIRDRILYVGTFIPKSERKSAQTAAKFNNCYVKNFGEEMTDEGFKTLFEKFGEIKSACIMKTPQGVSKGFGFVCFFDPVSAESAVKEMDGKEINGKPLYVSRAQRKEDRLEELKAKFSQSNADKKTRYPAGVNIYVKNLDDTIDDEKLRAAFGVYGDITSAKVMRDESGVSRCFGFVCFRNAEQATIALNSAQDIKLGSKKLFVALAQRKDDRIAKLSAENQARNEQMKSIYPMPHSFPFMHQNQVTRNLYARQYPTSGPRWQQQMVANPMATYQAGLGPQAANPQVFSSMMRMQNNPHSGSANMNARLGTGAGNAPAVGMNVPAQSLAQLPQYARPNQNPRAAMGSAAAMQSRLNMPTQNVQMMPNRAAQQMCQMNPPNANFMQQNRPAQQTRPSNVQVQSQHVHKENLQQTLESQKDMLGNRLYPIVEKKYPDNVAKITGLILSMNINEVASLFDDENQLEEAMDRAYTMLKNAGSAKGEHATEGTGDDKAK